jgi:hypothetical protein
VHVKQCEHNTAGRNTWSDASFAHLLSAVPELKQIAPAEYLLHPLLVAAALLLFMCLQWWAWPLYWIAQGTMFWALFVVGHDW